MDRNNKVTTNITYIHESIIINILCFLPADSVIRCGSVCKRWASLISSTIFAESYSLSGTAPLQFLLHGTVGVTQKHQHLVFADLAEASRNSHTPRYHCPAPIDTKSVLPHILDPKSSPHTLKICTTCNITGFIVAYSYPCFGDVFGHPYHIFNPITSQHIVVQQKSKNWGWRTCALVLAHKTNQLKLLKSIRERGGYHIEIQTIGTNLWRTAFINYPLFFHEENFGFPCFLNGIYHWGWCCSMRGGIVCFNPDDEVLDHIPTPQSPCIENYHNAYLGLLDGSFCICTKTSSVTVNGFQFWVMNEYGVPESWCKKLVIPIDGKQHTLSEPLRFWKYGEIVVLCDNYDVICYNPSTGKSTFITCFVNDDRLLSYVPIPYVPIFRRFVCSDADRGF